MMQIDIGDYLSDLQDETVYYKPNPGNAGDSLIAHSTFELFKKHRVNYCLPDWKTFNPKGKVIAFGGGGNLVGLYQDARKFIQKYQSVSKKFIILPHTIANNEDLLGHLGKNVDIICREEVSCNHARKYASKANVLAAEDLAFSLDVEHTLFNTPPMKLQDIAYLKFKKYHCLFRSSKTEGVRSIPRKLLNYNLLARKKEIEVVNCFRSGPEKTDIEIPDDNIDLSIVFALGIGETTSFYASFKFLNFINKCRKVKTNRLHICIAGALLGKEVFFYPNNYFKNRAVFEYSMKNRFFHVRWMGD
jgi:exopolysaccharide biosynthesis predicted pyruvyltransferase EpsI